MIVCAVCAHRVDHTIPNRIFLCNRKSMKRNPFVDNNPSRQTIAYYIEINFRSMFSPFDCIRQSAYVNANNDMVQHPKMLKICMRFVYKVTMLFALISVPLGTS